jgi:hypothetical protein
MSRLPASLESNPQLRGYANTCYETSVVLLLRLLLAVAAAAMAADLGSSSSEPLMPATHAFLRDSMLQLSIPTRDAAYYIPDGNTVLLVGNTLFRVHRSTLVRDRSAFESMFSLAPDAAAETSITSTEGETDDNPIRLQGDTADEFRALLWALYPSPHELTAALTPNADVARLFALARIAHKYQFSSLSTWALAALHTYYTRPGAFETLPSSPTPNGPNQAPTLADITELAALCEHAELLAATTARWRRQLADGRDVALALTLAERLALRPLLGIAYHAMLLKGREYWDADPHLTRSQRIRLLSGHYALGKLYDELPNNAPPLTHSARCSSQPKCNKAWAMLWRATLELGPQIIAHQRGDVLGKLVLAETFIKALVEKEIPTQGMLDGLPNCRENALQATSQKVREIRESLADYFTDVL